MRRYFFFPIPFFLAGGLAFLPSCSSNLGIPSGPPNPTATFTPTAGTPTSTFTPTPGSPTPTQTPTPTGSLTSTPTPTGTPTGSPTPTPQVCAPTPAGLSAGVSTLLYGQSHLYVIRTQSDWDAYTGISGSTPPVNFSTQMLLVENWGTESCLPGNGLVVEYNITSACVNASSIDVRITYGSTCTCGATCVYIGAPTQVSAAVLPAYSLPVSIVP